MKNFHSTSCRLKFILGSLFNIMLASCGNEHNEKEKINEPSAIQGLASPIRLKFDSTIVYLSDYFPAENEFGKIEWNNKQWLADSSGMLLLTGKASTPVSNLHIELQGNRYDIPVFGSEKVKHVFKYKATNASVEKVEMSGSMNGWNRKATPLVKDGDLWKAELVLNTGLYQYRIWEDGMEMMDAGNADKIDNGMGAFNNTFFAGEKSGKLPEMTSKSFQDGMLEIIMSDTIGHVLAYHENQLTEVIRNGQQIKIKVPDAAKKMKRSFIRVFADNGILRYNDILIPLSEGMAITEPEKLQRNDLQASVMYFALVDRFVNGDSTNDRPTPDPAIHPKANNLGGDLAGITAKIKDGYFQSIGINTIWISPVSQNAEGAWGLWDKGTTSKFSAYHGYWPTALRSIDNRFGNEAQMKELIDLAHQNGMNVILDYVAHHVHQEHPLYKQKPEWTTPLYLPDGSMNTEKWDEHRLTTWFDTFLPTWNFAKPEVVEALTDTAMYWVEHYDLDGFRHDATKHINEDFWRTLTHKIKTYKASHPDRHIYQVGETYGSPELIASYINSGQMDAQFDFNLYDAAVDAFAKDETDFKNLERVILESMNYYGYHNVMVNITGNQDRARFISYADGSVQFSEDPKLAGWTRDIINADANGYKKLGMLNAFLMTAPGIPCIYYGDEIGMPGANDPDNRRMMHFKDWNNSQQELFNLTSQLVKLRRENMALSYGDLFILKNDNRVLAFVRSYLGKNILVVFRKSGAQMNDPEIIVPPHFQVSNAKSIGDNRVLYENGIIRLPAHDATMESSFTVFY